MNRPRDHCDCEITKAIRRFDGDTVEVIWHLARMALAGSAINVTAKVISEEECEDAVQIGNFGSGSISFCLVCVGRLLITGNDVH